MKVFIDAVAVAAPGIKSWDDALPVLKGEQPYQAEPLDRYKPMLLPSNERRRATELIRLAFRICEDAVKGYEYKLENLASVFATSCGDFHIIDQVCRTLCQPERMVSPTQFHNSVHNSAAGYWSIAIQSRAPSTSLSAYDHTFQAGLIEASSMVMAQQQQTLLAVYDTLPPSPLAAKRAIVQPFATALLLSPTASEKSLGQLSLTLTTNESIESACTNSDMETLRLSNPAARSLPLLELLANQQAGNISLSTPASQTLNLSFQPCN
ncbi:MAG: beta-ketoacyl synthase chain length factor [Pseudomonadales bacterium]